MFKTSLVAVSFLIALVPTFAHANYLSVITDVRITWSSDFIDTLDGKSKTSYMLEISGSFSDVSGESGDHIAVRALGGDWLMTPNTGGNHDVAPVSWSRGYRRMYVNVPRSGVIEVKVCMDSDLTHPCSDPFIATFLPEASLVAIPDVSRDNPTVHLRVSHFVQPSYTDYILKPTDPASTNVLNFFRSPTNCKNPEGFCDLTFPNDQLPSAGPYYLQFINQLGMTGQPLMFTLWDKPQVLHSLPAMINTMADTEVIFQFDNQYAAPNGSTVMLMSKPCSGKVLPLTMFRVDAGRFTIPASCMYNSLTATSISVQVTNPGGTVQYNVPMFIPIHITPGPHPAPPPVGVL